VEPRTKKLITVLIIFIVAAVGFYGLRQYKKATLPPPKFTIKMGIPIARPQAATAKPAEASAAPAVAAVKAGAEKTEPAGFNVAEKGKVIKYKSAEEFVDKTSLTQQELDAYVAKRLAEANKAYSDLKVQGAKADKNASEAAAVEVRDAERLVSLAAQKSKAPEKKVVIVYSAQGKRDPFMNPLEIPKVYPPVPANAKPYERVPAEKLALKAVIWNEKGYRALVTAPDGRGYTVKVGDRLGDKLGRITRITENSVVVVEYIKDILDNVETNTIVLRLNSKEAK
jgi:Tfp pilus assembly protein PilP